jgi:nitrite reductase (NADH) large subunit
MKKKVLIIGAGPAGLAAAEAAAALGSSVTLAGAEPYPPYWRPRLTRCLSEPAPIESLYMRKPEWYAQRGIELITDHEAEHVDIEGKKVYWIKRGEAPETPFDALVAATGSAPARPQIRGAENALTFRTYEDAVRIREAALAAGRAVVIGGGLLGLETAWELNRAGVKTVIIERNRWLMPRQLDCGAGQYLQRRLEGSGLEFAIGRDPSDCADLYSGSCIVLAAGVRANLGALGGCALAVNRGIVVDGRMRTSADGIYACGDAAEFGGRCWGLLTVAQAQGKAAGANAAGGDSAYEETPPSPMLKVGAVSVFSVGSLAEDENTALLGGETGTGYVSLALRDGVLAGAALVGDTKDGMKLKKAVAENRRFEKAAGVEDILRSMNA